MGLLGDAHATAPRRPNVVLIVLDAWRADRLGANGARPGLTRFLDSLADRAYVLRRAYAPVSHTPASIASLLTARYPPRHGVRWFDTALPDGMVSLPRLLRDEGYLTALFTRSYLFADAAKLFEFAGRMKPESRRQRLDRRLRELQESFAHTDVQTTVRPLDPATVERLRALGYVTD